MQIRRSRTIGLLGDFSVGAWNDSEMWVKGLTLHWYYSLQLIINLPEMSYCFV